MNNEIQNFNLKTVKWKIHLENFEETVLQLNEIIASSNWPSKWQYDVKTVWLEISVLECIGYLANERDGNNWLSLIDVAFLMSTKDACQVIDKQERIGYATKIPNYASDFSGN